MPSGDFLKIVRQVDGFQTLRHLVVPFGDFQQRVVILRIAVQVRNYAEFCGSRPVALSPLLFVAHRERP